MSVDLTQAELHAARRNPAESSDPLLDRQEGTSRFSVINALKSGWQKIKNMSKIQKIEMVAFVVFASLIPSNHILAGVGLFITVVAVIAEKAVEAINRDDLTQVDGPMYMG